MGQINGYHAFIASFPFFFNLSFEAYGILLWTSLLHKPEGIMEVHVKPGYLQFIKPLYCIRLSMILNTDLE